MLNTERMLHPIETDKLCPAKFDCVYKISFLCIFHLPAADVFFEQLIKVLYEIISSQLCHNEKPYKSTYCTAHKVNYINLPDKLIYWILSYTQNNYREKCRKAAKCDQKNVLNSCVSVWLQMKDAVI